MIPSNIFCNGIYVNIGVVLEVSTCLLGYTEHILCLRVLDEGHSSLLRDRGEKGVCIPLSDPWDSSELEDEYSVQKKIDKQNLNQVLFWGQQKLVGECA